MTMTDPNEIRARVAALEERARNRLGTAFVSLTCWPDRWRAGEHMANLNFEGATPDEALAGLEAIFSAREQHESDLARTLGVEVTA